MKILTLLGTRPEIIRLSRVIERLDAAVEHVLVHTGQNYDPALSDVFFDGLRVREPDHYLGIRAPTFGAQIGAMFTAAETVLRDEQPDRLLILGDTNSGLAAIVAKRLGIRVFHMEAGNRCYDDRVPEEINRRVIDHCSDVLMPYTERSRANLIREGIEGERIFVTGNPILEVIDHHEADIAASTVLDRLQVEPQGFFLVTMHREENVDVPERLRALVAAVNEINDRYERTVVCSIHPRTREMLRRLELADGNRDGVVFSDPLGFFDFIALERAAYCVLSDSGTVQEECCIFRVPNVTIRDVTERPETIECGSNILSGVEPESIVRCVATVLAQAPDWTPPPEYLVRDVSATVTKLLLSF